MPRPIALILLGFIEFVQEKFGLNYPMLGRIARRFSAAGDAAPPIPAGRYLSHTFTLSKNNPIISSPPTGGED